MEIEQLQAKYAYMFTSETRVVSMYRGWLPALAGACALIDAALGVDKQGFHWREIGESRDECRFAYALGNSRNTVIDLQRLHEGVLEIRSATREGDPVAQRIKEIVASAEARTELSCIVCGTFGFRKAHNGFSLTLCDDHTIDDVVGAIVGR